MNQRKKNKKNKGIKERNGFCLRFRHRASNTSSQRRHSRMQWWSHKFIVILSFLFPSKCKYASSIGLNAIYISYFFILFYAFIIMRNKCNDNKLCLSSKIKLSENIRNAFAWKIRLLWFTCSYYCFVVDSVNVQPGSTERTQMELIKKQDYWNINGIINSKCNPETKNCEEKKEAKKKKIK